MLLYRIESECTLAAGQSQEHQDVFLRMLGLSTTVVADFVMAATAEVAAEPIVP